MAKAHTLSFSSWAGNTSFSGYDANRTITGDTLTIKTLNSYPTVTAVTTWDLTESHFGTTIITTPAVGAGSTEAMFGLTFDANNSLAIGWTNNSLYARRRTAGTNNDAGYLGYNPTVHKYLRIREAAGTTYWEFSGDGTTWSNIRPPEANPFSMVALTPYILSGYWSGTETATTSQAVYGGVNSYTTTPALTWGTNQGMVFSASTPQSPGLAADVDEVSALAGRRPVRELWYQNLSTGVSASGLSAVDGRGASNFLTWEFWNGTDSSTYNYAAILAGNHNTAIDAAANVIKTFGKTVWLRPFHEMNGTWYPWCIGVHGNTAAQHKQAWAYVRQRFEAAGANNVRWVWSPNTNFTGSAPLAGIYPGDNMVDAVAVDGYNFGVLAPDTTTWLTPSQVFDPTFADLRALGIRKPYWIGETGCAETGGDKAAWITSFFQWMSNQPELEEFVWFHLNKERDWRINSTPAAASAFLAGMDRLGHTVEPWERIALEGAGSSSWVQAEGPTTTIAVSGRQANLIAPPGMAQQVIRLDNKTRQVYVIVNPSQCGIKQADGTIAPFRFRRFPVDADPTLPAHNPTPDITAQYRTATVDVNPSIRSYAITSHNNGGTATAKPINRPRQVVAGDLLVLFAIADSGTLANNTTMRPSGFTELGRVVGSPGARIAVFYKVAVASDAGGTINYGSYPTGADGASLMMAVKNWSGSTAGLTYGGSTVGNTTMNSPSVVPKTARSLLLNFIASDDDAALRTWGWIPPVTGGAVGYTNHVDVQTGMAWASGAVSQEIVTGTTATGVRTWSVNTASTQTTRITASLTIPAGTATKTITEMLNEFTYTGGKDGPLTDTIDNSYTDSEGVTSTYHLFAAGLDWSKNIGLMVYTDGSGEYGLLTSTINGPSEYLLDGPNGLINVAKRRNMVLLTPRAPGGPCDDGDGVCWYDHSAAVAGGSPARSPWEKLEWSNELIRWVLTRYNIDRRRMVISGYSSGAQWTTSWWGPKYGSEIMLDGLALAFSYGGQPRVQPKITAAYKANVEHVWNVGTLDESYTQPTYDDGVQTGRAWYINNGFAVTDLQLVQGQDHERDVVVNGVETADFGEILEREILARVIPA